MSNAPEVRGLFLKALGRPVIVAPSSAEPTVTFDGPLTEVCSCSLKETELPVVVRAGEETYEVRPTRTGERTINGRVALVTGGAQGFGAGFFRRKGRFFGHRDAPCRKFKQRSIAKRARQGKEGGRPPGTGPCGLRGCRLRHGTGPCACRASQDTPRAGGRLCGRAQKLRYSGINLNNCQGEKGRLCGGRSGARCSCSLYRIPLQVPMPCRRAGADGRAFGPRRQTAGPFAGKGVPRQGMRLLKSFPIPARGPQRRQNEKKPIQKL